MNEDKKKGAVGNIVEAAAEAAAAVVADSAATARIARETAAEVAAASVDAARDTAAQVVQTAAAEAAAVVANASALATVELAEALDAGHTDPATVTEAAAIAAARVAEATNAAADAVAVDGDTAARIVHAAAAEAARVIVAATAEDCAKIAAVFAKEADQLEEYLQQTERLSTVGQLAGSIAHDFNNLLTVISGFTELALEASDRTHPCDRELLEVQKAAARGATLTRQLLAFSRRQVLQPHVLDVNALVTGIKTFLQQAVGEDIALVTASEVVAPVRVDASQLEQVLLNLALNARDAMPDGGTLRIVSEMVTVDVAVGDPSMTPGRYVRVTVSDTGVGMTPETQAHIFDPFFTTKPVGKGTGLGLATVYGIVKQSGGFVRVESHVGRGTSFVIDFPAVDAAVDPPVRVVIAERISGGSETILLAEDDDGVRGLVRQMLTDHGYTVLHGCNGDDALRVARQHGDVIHLLVADVMMPNLNGPGLVALLRMERPNVGVLYMSGYADKVTAHAGVGPDVQVLGKPFLPKDLLRRVRGILDTLSPANAAVH